MAKAKSAKEKSPNTLSSAELYELAREREQEEQMEQQQALAGEVEALKAQRRALGAAYRKDLRAIDARLTALGGPGKRKAAQTRKKRVNTTELILQFLSAQGQASTAEIRTHLQESGLEASNLSQLMGNLKRRSKVVSAGRAVYALAP